MRPVPIALVVLRLALSGGPARADEPKPDAGAVTEAKAHADAASRFFAVQKYAEAIAELQKAYLLDPQPDYVYALAQAQRLSGDCDAAVRSYQTYLRTGPPEAQAALARENLEKCQADLAQKPPPASLPTSRPAAPPPPARPVEQAPERPFARDVVGHIYTGGGLVVAVAGTLVFRLGQHKIDHINDAPTYGSFVSRRDDLSLARAEQVLGITGLVAGTALIGAGVFHYLGYWRLTLEPDVTARLDGGAVFSVRGSF